MKSFSQFLQESYLSEEIPAGMTRAQYNALPAESRRRLSGGSGAAMGRQGQPLSGAASAPAIRSARAQVGAAPEVSQTNAIASQATQPEVKPQGTTTKVASPARKPSGAAADPFKQFPGKPQKQYGIPQPPSSRVPYGSRTLPGTPSRPALPAAGQTSAKPPKAGALATRPAAVPSAPAGTPSNPINIRTNMNVPGGKPPAGPKIKVPAGAGKALRVGGRLLGPAAAALDVADERSKGSGWLRSLAKGAAVAAGGALGGAAGSVAGPVGSVGGAVGGSMAASKAFDVAAGANAAQRKAMATANRQAQSGGALKGIGGKTTFDTKKGTMTTGAGSQQKTVKLGKTSVVTDPKTGKQDVGYLAYKGGKAVYKRADTKNLAQTSSNPLERIGRSLFAGAYKQSDAAAAAKKLAAARQSDVARQKALGVKMKPGG